MSSNETNTHFIQGKNRRTEANTGQIGHEESTNQDIKDSNKHSTRVQSQRKKDAQMDSRNTKGERGRKGG